MKKERLAILYTFITIILWGTVAAVSKLMLRDINNFQLMFYVSLFSTIILFTFVLFKGKLNKSIGLFKENKLHIILLGILGLGISQFFYFTALSEAPATQVNVLNYLWPIFILIFSIFILKEKFSWKILISFLLGLIGAVIIITEGKFIVFNSNYLLGYFFALCAAFSWGLFSVLSKKKKVDPLLSVFLFNLIGLIFMFLIMLFTKTSFNISFNSLIGTLYIGVIPTGLAFLLWIKAIHIGKASTIANLAHLTPFVSLLFIFVILKEQISLNEIVGLVIIVSGVLLQNFKRR